MTYNLIPTSVVVINNGLSLNSVKGGYYLLSPSKRYRKGCMFLLTISTTTYIPYENVECNTKIKRSNNSSIPLKSL